MTPTRAGAHRPANVMWQVVAGIAVGSLVLAYLDNRLTKALGGKQQPAPAKEPPPTAQKQLPGATGSTASGPVVTNVPLFRKLASKLRK